MAKSIYIAEKPSVAQEFAKALKISGSRHDGYIENADSIVTWCVGHLVTLCYPEEYDINLKRWSLDTLPFIPKDWKYEVIQNVSKQFNVVKTLLNREDVDKIYVCTDSGREGEYIYRLVERQAQVKDKKRLRVWIDSQTEEEILRGINEAKDLSYYDNLSDAAYLRAQEDYLMGINFSRVLTLKYAYGIKQYLGLDKSIIKVGRVMTCVLGMIVNREREIRAFVKTPFYRVVGISSLNDDNLELEWRACAGSKYFETPYLYKENGFKEEKTAKELIDFLKSTSMEGVVDNIEKKNENKNPPLLFNLAELQNECSKLLKISPDETLSITQELYEKKLVTYPRTDARVLSEAVCKVIVNNIKGLVNYPPVKTFADNILKEGTYKNIAKSKYCNDKQITDHYAIIPTGQGFNNYNSLSDKAKRVYDAIVRRFLSIFYSPAKYQKFNININLLEEHFFASFKVLKSEGYLRLYGNNRQNKEKDEENGDVDFDESMLMQIEKMKKGDKFTFDDFTIKEGETSPPKRYNSGSIILAMENAGSLIEDEELRAQIKGSGIGTSATRAEILKKLVDSNYIAINKKTQIITPLLQGEMIFDVVNCSIRSLLNPELTASWEKGLDGVAKGEISKEEYLEKMEGFVRRRTDGVKQLNNSQNMRAFYDRAAVFYKK